MAMPELVAGFTEKTGIPVDVTLGSSGQIAYQIDNGAPVDVFLSADPGWVGWLGERGRLVPGTEAEYAMGSLVLVTLRGSRLAVRDMTDLAHPAVRRIAIANPEHAPYGRAARRALQSGGLWDDLLPRIVIAENVRQAIQYVDTRAVDVAIGALSLVRDEEHEWMPVPEHLHGPLVQTLAIVADRPREEQAREYRRFVLGPTGREILARHRFLLPEPPPRP